LLLPEGDVNRLNVETRTALALPRVRKLVINLGADPIRSKPEAFDVFVKSEFDARVSRPTQ
jgi:hypothetical protein